ncbi:MAG: PQQ-dependent sugar dehydrogenase [Gammaproteobacteria bacterium]|nr:PQQ-dependent sugar dehydrogenase [Gammaproteobacteria bacterium]
MRPNKGSRIKSLIIASAFACTASALAQTNDIKIKVTELTDDLHRPWAVEVLPNQDLVITERNGDVRVWQNGQLSDPIKGLPEVHEVGQGGLLDVKAHPNFTQNSTLYFTYAKGTNDSNRTVLAKAKLQSPGETGRYQLVDVIEIFSALPKKERSHHYSGRIEFLPDGTLIFAVGDGGRYQDKAQLLDNHLGKVIRLNDDGSLPSDNPYANDDSVLSEIYSYGHRNPQGMFYDEKRQLLFSNEHGPKGGDEINIIEPTKNYGWPAITYGVNYSGTTISEFTHKEGMEQPLLQWTPSIAPSSIMVYYGNEFPQFQGHILTTALKFEELRLVRLSSPESGSVEVLSQQTLLKEQEERLRDIAMNSKGQLYIITDSGKLWHLTKH